MNLLLPAWIALGFLGLVGLLAQPSVRRRSLGQLGLAAVVLAAAIVVIGLPARNSARPSGKDGLKIITFNLWQDNRSPARAAAWIRGERPDIVVLIEAKGRSSQVPAMLEDMFPHRISCHPVVPCSTIILSHAEPTAAVPLARGDPENRRALSAAMMRFGAAPDAPAVLAVHLSRPYPLGSQRGELALLDAAIDTVSPRHLILLGDFNANASTLALRDLATRHGLAPIISWAPTWPAPSSSLPVPAFIALDHIMIGPGWSIGEFRRGPDLGSDHYPLVAMLYRSGA